MLEISLYFSAMCYDVQVLTKKNLRYAIQYTTNPDERKILEEEYRRLEPAFERLYHGNAFAHPHLICHTNEEPLKARAFYWGLIPPWVKDEKSALNLSNKTVNARGETIFEKPAFRSAANKRRCLISLDAFYEHFHYKGKTYPFHIELKSEDPMVVAGLWERWYNEGRGEEVHSISIVTTQANSLMQRLHNNPKIEEPRMPLLLLEEDRKKWLADVEEPTDKQAIQELIRPFPDGALKAHPVGRLRGKQAVGNVPEVLERVEYPELAQSDLPLEEIEAGAL